ncbi:MAG TPA: DUF3365 domain-containing protein [Lacibacter sp.]|nr:DUF3365 domain-containing protein [Lacibacter sp.]HMO90337.1 DUF3365 domain-containing protein [Lacibacter sp.]HMP86551.1 DUF3365 domain-containing protein [Lacibacter sp.]
MRIVVLFSLLVTLSACYSENEQEERPAMPEDAYLRRGDSITRLTFDTLRNTLQRVIAASGPEGAVSFCQVAALPLTGTFSGETVHVRRTSLRFRNPLNAPDSLENHYLQLLGGRSSGDARAWVDVSDTGNVHYFKPIFIQPLCLNCHGNREKEISAATWRVIQAAYPGDRAFGYRVGELRGAWHLVFRRN